MCLTPADVSDQQQTCSLCPRTSKYRCPKCEVRSCSLQCVRDHKAATACDGKRDKTKFKPLGNMKDMDVVSDFRLLEDITRGLDKCRRDKIKRSTRQGTEMMRAPRLQKHLQRLQQQCRLRGVRLRLLPPHFARRKENTSVFDFKERVVKWKVEVVFPHCTPGPRTLSLEAVSEKTKVWRLLEEVLEGGQGGEAFLHYAAVGYGGLSLFLKAEGQPGPGEGPRRFYPLDMKRSLKTNLKNRAVVEHPIIHVVYKSEEMNYREEQDLCLEEPPELEEPGPGGQEEPVVTVGDVMSDTEAMAADPEAYKQYFDFYLKYYSSKYKVQGAAPPGSAPLTSHPAQLLLNRPHGPPPPHQFHAPPPSQQFHSRPPASFHSAPPPFQANYRPDFNRPPPSYCPPPSGYPARSAPPPTLSSDPTHKFSRPPPSLSNFSRPPPSLTPPISLNASNVASAQNIKKELQKTAGLGLLAAYGSGSDSDSD